MDAFNADIIAESGADSMSTDDKQSNISAIRNTTSTIVASDENISNFENRSLFESNEKPQEISNSNERMVHSTCTELSDKCWHKNHHACIANELESASIDNDERDGEGMPPPTWESSHAKVLRFLTDPRNESHLLRGAATNDGSNSSNSASNSDHSANRNGEDCHSRNYYRKKGDEQIMLDSDVDDDDEDYAWFDEENSLRGIEEGGTLSKNRRRLAEAKIRAQKQSPFKFVAPVGGNNGAIHLAQGANEMLCRQTQQRNLLASVKKTLSLDATAAEKGSDVNVAAEIWRQKRRNRLSLGGLSTLEGTSVPVEYLNAINTAAPVNGSINSSSLFIRENGKFIYNDTAIVTAREWQREPLADECINKSFSFHKMNAIATSSTTQPDFETSKITQNIWRNDILLSKSKAEADLFNRMRIPAPMTKKDTRSIEGKLSAAIDEESESNNLMSGNIEEKDETALSALVENFSEKDDLLSPVMNKDDDSSSSTGSVHSVIMSLNARSGGTLPTLNFDQNVDAEHYSSDCELINGEDEDIVEIVGQQNEIKRNGIENVKDDNIIEVENDAGKEKSDINNTDDKKRTTEKQFTACGKGSEFFQPDGKENDENETVKCHFEATKKDDHSMDYAEELQENAPSLVTTNLCEVFPQTSINAGNERTTQSSRSLNEYNKEMTKDEGIFELNRHEQASAGDGLFTSSSSMNVIEMFENEGKQSEKGIDSALSETLTSNLRENETLTDREKKREGTIFSSKKSGLNDVKNNFLAATNSKSNENQNENYLRLNHIGKNDVDCWSGVDLKASTVSASAHQRLSTSNEQLVISNYLFISRRSNATNGKNDCANEKSLADAERMKIESNDNLKNSVLSDVTRKKDQERAVGNEFVKQNEFAPQYCQDSIANGTTEKISIEEDTTSNDKKGRTKGKASRSCWNLNGTQWQQWASPAEKTVTKTDVETLTEQTPNFVNSSSITATESMVNQRWRKICGAEAGGYAVATLPSNAHKMASAAGNFAPNHHRQNSSPQSTEIDYCKFAVGRKLLEREAVRTEENKLQPSKMIGELPTAKTNDLSVSVQLEVTREQCASISASCTIPYRTESCSPPISPTLINVAKKLQRHHMLQNERLHFLLPDFPSKNNSPVGQKSNSNLSSAISANRKSNSDIVNSAVVQPLPRFDDYYNQQNERSKNIPVPSKNSQNDGSLVGFSVNNSNNRVTIVDIPLDNEQPPTGTTNYASDDRRDGVLNHNHRSINPVSKTRRTAPLQTWRSSSASSLRSDEKWEEDRNNAEYSSHNSVMKCIEPRSNGAQQSLFGHQSRAAGRVALVATPPRRGRSAAENSNQDCAVRWEPIGTLPRTATVALNGTFDDFKQSLLSDVNKNSVYCTGRKDAIDKRKDAVGKGRGIGSCSNLLDKNAKSEYSRIQNNNNNKKKPSSSTNNDNTNNRNTFHLTTPTTKQTNLSTNSSENDKLLQRRQRSTTVSLTNLGVPNGDCRNNFWKPNTQQQEVASNSVDVGKRSKVGVYAHFPSLSLTGNSGSSGIGSASQSSASAASPSSSAGCEDSDVANGNQSNRRQMQAKSEANNDYRVVSLSDRPGPGRLDDFVPEVERVIVSPTGTGSFCWLVQNTENGEFMEYYDAKPEDKNVIPSPAVAVKAVMRGHSSAAASPTFVRRRHASAFTENEVRHPRLICNYNLDPTEPTTTPRKATLTEPKTESTTSTVSVARQFLSSANNFGNTTNNKQQPQQQQQQQRRKISEVKKGAKKITESDFLRRNDENREKVGQTFDKSIPEQTSRLFSDIRTPPQPSNGQLVERDRFGRVIVDSRERRQFMAEQRMAKPGEASNLLNADSKMKIIHYGVGKTSENDDQRPKIKVLSNFGSALCNANDYGAESGKSVATATKSSPTVQFHQQLQQSSQFYDGGGPVYDAVPQHPPNVTQRKTTAPFNSSKSINDGIGQKFSAIGQHPEHKLKQTSEANHHPITPPPSFSVPPRKNGVASTGIRAEIPKEFPLSGAAGVRRHLMEKACRDVGAGSVAPISSYSVTTRIDANNNSIFPTAAERGKWKGNGSVQQQMPPLPLTTTTTILSGASSASINKPNPLDRMMKNGVNGSTNDSTKSNFKGFDARTNGILSNTPTGNQAPIPRPRSAGGNFSNVRFADEPKNEEFMRMQKSGGFMQRNNFCNNSTAEEEQPKREVKPENICSNCGNQLGSGNAMIIESMGLSYHISCFCCFRCRTKLADGSRPIEVNILYGSKLHCSECYSDATRLNAAERIGFANNERGRNVNGLAI